MLVIPEVASTIHFGHDLFELRPRCPTPPNGNRVPFVFIEEVLQHEVVSAPASIEAANGLCNDVIGVIHAASPAGSAIAVPIMTEDRDESKIKETIGCVAGRNAKTPNAGKGYDIGPS